MDIDPLVKAVEDRLAELGWRKNYFCNQLEISTQAYNNWRKRGIPEAKRYQVAKLLGWPPEPVMEGRPPDAQGVKEVARGYRVRYLEEASPEQRSELERLERMIREERLPPKALGHILDLVEDLTGKD